MQTITLEATSNKVGNYTFWYKVNLATKVTSSYSFRIRGE